MLMWDLFSKWDFLGEKKKPKTKHIRNSKSVNWHTVLSVKTQKASAGFPR